MLKVIDELKEMYQYHTPTAEEVVTMKEIATLAHVLSDKIAQVVEEGEPHTMAFDLKCQSLLNIKTAVMQANAAMIVGRVVGAKIEDAQPKQTADDILRRDLQKAMSAITSLPDLIGQARQRNATERDAVTVATDSVAGQGEPKYTAKEVIDRIKKANPGLVIKVRRRKSR